MSRWPLPQMNPEGVPLSIAKENPTILIPQWATIYELLELACTSGGIGNF